MNISEILINPGQFLYNINKQTQNKQDEYFEDGVKVIGHMVSAVSNVSSFDIWPIKVDETNSDVGHEGSESSSRSSKLNPSRRENIISPASSAASIDSDDLTSLASSGPASSSDLGAASSASASSTSAASSASAASIASVTPLADTPFSLTPSRLLTRPWGPTLGVIGGGVVRQH